MKKCVPTTELRVGMYVNKLGGSWMKHPFIRGSFLLTDPDDIQRILAADIKEVWIDVEKGVQSPKPKAQSPKPKAQSPKPKIVSEALSAPSSPPIKKTDGASSMASEIKRAKEICLAAKGQVVAMFQDARLGKAIDPQTTLPLVDEISASVQRNAAAILSVARLKSHDDYTYMHSVAVCALMLSLAKQLGLDEEQTRMAGVGGLMHDLGKASMPLEILNKPGKLTDAEFDVMKTHPEAGAHVLRKGGAAAEVEDIALHHHEKINGRGYPHGLQGEEISLLARMGCVCDVYDAVTSQRSYKAPWDPAHTMREMAHWEGHFDKRVFNAFVKSVGIYPVGSLVRLSSKRLAVVIEPGIESLLTPKIRVFFSLVSKEPVPLTVVDLAAPGCKERIVGPEDPEKWRFTHLDSLWMSPREGK